MLRADAVVVGSGPAGAAAAHALVRRGISVLMLEAGARPDPDRFAMMERAIDRDAIPWESTPYVYETKGDDLDLNTFAVRRVGGSSLAWGAVVPRFLQADFELQSRRGVAVDWPVSYDELEPFYDEAERLMGVSGATDNPWAARRARPFPMAHFPMSDADVLVKGACERLGIALHSVPVARNSTPYDGRSACSYYSACRACPIGAMYSSDQTIARLEGLSSFRILPEREVDRVELDGGGRARRVIFRSPEGREDAAEAQLVILATQTVETVRILLNSATGSFPEGLANRSGTLGVNLMEHPKFYLRGRVRERVQPYLQGFETATSYQFHDHERRGEWAGGRLLVREAAGPTPAMVARESGRWGARLREEIREIFGRYVVLGAFLEQLPSPQNRVSLSRRVRRGDGRPAPLVEFRLMGEYERRGYQEMKKVMERIFEALGATQVEVLLPPSNSGHYMGGHRMGLDPETSVTDPFLEAHDVPGLFLAGAGAFPTAGVMNPTLTTAALVLRMADHIGGAWRVAAVDVRRL